ncbi:MAG: menaquinone biosynthetic enzyme MqnA/MqnD family protein [Halobacteria archaeon]
MDSPVNRDGDIVRVGRIDFANSDPVYYGLENGSVDVPGETSLKLIDGFPVALNSMLEHGDIDLAPISSIEYARSSQNYRILPDLSVTSDGKVVSIYLFSKKPPDELEEVAVTSTSETSVTLLRILLREKYGVEPEFHRRDPYLEDMFEDCDAALVIGDHALLEYRKLENSEDSGADVEVLDLGEEWKEMTGEMMVYAVWAVRDDVEDVDVVNTHEGLLISKKEGYRNLDVIAEDVAERLDLSYSVAEEYVALLDHGFDEGHARGLEKYYEFAEQNSEIESVPDIRIFEK